MITVWQNKYVFLGSLGKLFIMLHYIQLLFSTLLQITKNDCCDTLYVYAPNVQFMVSMKQIQMEQKEIYKTKVGCMNVFIF